jgi:predicted MPP superfamily phosphohydrolase
LRRRFGVFVALVESVLLLSHLLFYETWIYFWRISDASTLTGTRVVIALLSLSFVTASLLSFRYRNIAVRMFYTIAAVWLAIFNYAVFAAIACWLVYGLSSLLGAQWERRDIGATLFGAALLISAYGLANAAWTRVAHVTIKLANLPESWRGRVAALVSDLHLGHVRNGGFMARIVKMLERARADIVFVPGDMYDGSAVDIPKLAEPWTALRPPLGIFFTLGNHEEFSDPTKYLNAVSAAGLRVLNNEKIEVDGMQIVGMHYRDSANPMLFRSILQRAALDRSRPSILLTHAPDRPAVAEQEGISLQLSGHTHGGQFFPYTRITARMYGQFVHGLSRLNTMQVFTTWGAGTWGPPMRLGTKPEIVLITFQQSDASGSD